MKGQNLLVLANRNILSPKVRIDSDVLPRAY